MEVLVLRYSYTRKLFIARKRLIVTIVGRFLRKEENCSYISGQLTVRKTCDEVVKVFTLVGNVTNVTNALENIMIEATSA